MLCGFANARRTTLLLPKGHVSCTLDSLRSSLMVVIRAAGAKEETKAHMKPNHLCVIECKKWMRGDGRQLAQAPGEHDFFHESPPASGLPHPHPQRQPRVRQPGVPLSPPWTRRHAAAPQAPPTPPHPPTPSVPPPSPPFPVSLYKKRRRKKTYAKWNAVACGVYPQNACLMDKALPSLSKPGLLA